MKLIRYEYPTINDIDRLFGHTLPTLNRLGTVWDRLFDNYYHSTAPVTDLYEDDANYYVRVELPGVKREAVELSLENSVLTLGVKAQRTDESQALHYTVSRSISVPENVRQDTILAKLEEGVLTVTLPKAATTPSRVIEVK